MEKTEKVIHLNDKTREKVEKYLKDGETYITENELTKRQKLKCHSGVFTRYLNEFVEKSQKRKEDVELIE